MHSSHPRSAAVAALVAGALATGLLTGTAGAAEGVAADGAVRIHDIQGTTRISPLNGKQVTDVAGIVTGVRAHGSRGFWIQDPDADDNAATSEGIFVFTGSAPTVAVGDAVKVSGLVGEYVPGGVNSGNQSVTQISKPAVTVVSSGNALPEAAAVNEYTVPAAYAPAGDPAAAGSINGLALNPSRYALDFYESLEGMNVAIGTSRVVGATAAEYGELWVTVKGWENNAKRGGTLYGSYESQNTGRLKVQQLAPLAQQPFPVANVGDKLTGTTEGPMDFNQFGGYTLAARTLGTLSKGTTAPEKTKAQAPGELAVATYNVENLDPTDPQEKFDALGKAVVENLASPDILALEEIQDDNGAKNDGTVSAEQTLARFTAAIAAAGGPSYQWRTVNPSNNQDGGEPGGNIRQVFLFNPARVSFTDRAAGDATTATGVTTEKGRAALTHSPGRIDPANPAWKDSRKPLAGEFVFRGRPVFVIANHFGSKGGDEALTSHHQPPARPSEAKRLQQAQAVNAFVKELLAVDKNAKVLALGDINDFEFSDTTKALEDGGALYSAIKSLPKSERYSYVFQGNAQVLDQILVSPAVKGYTYDSVHINAEFSAQNSDHDPQVLRFRP
ncbi:endonuclease/exonuclease/phosphatase family protein [Streptomyces sp. BR123]|uniref:endonuclease/exonuclease/phosphatase family protein n=1 Tax=Streptomyces sp. BR123 TaxID=2749828 RepID=UPI0015C48CB7|nr:endonuclease/exonuclease/phosphatase family protein [Streptomyces sp. BR123]NXY93127.1 endonuclease/exonuclease/phosphatase family protein [Streptomyces sp. BR123]